MAVAAGRALPGERKVLPLQLRWTRAFRSRILALVAASSLVPALLLLGGSLYLNSRVQQQMRREVDEALNLAINLEQTLIDGSLNRMRDRAVALAAHPEVVSALASGGDPAPVLDAFQRALPEADLITVVGPDSRVVARAGSPQRGEAVRYGGLVERVLSSKAAADSAVVITPEELEGEPAALRDKVRMPIIETAGSQDPRTGQVLMHALALTGAAPVLSPDGAVIGVVLVSDILNNDHTIVDEVRHRSPQALPVDASIALDGVRVTTTVPAPGGSQRAVGTLYSDVVMERLRAGQEYRGRALVGGWLWQRTIYLPLRDPSGEVIAAPFVGISEAAFAELARSTSLSTAVAVVLALAALVGPPLVARRVTDRMAQSLAHLADLSGALRAAGGELAQEQAQIAAAFSGAVASAEDALRAAEQLGESAGQAGARMRDLEVALTRINAGSEEQTRTLRHAGRIVALVTQAVQESRGSFDAVLESLRAAIAAAQQGRHGALRAASSLELLRLDAEPADAGEGPGRLERLISDLEQAQHAVADCDAALADIARRTGEITERIWALVAVTNESGARAGAVSQQMADLTQVAEETAARLRSTTEATRHAIAVFEALAESIGSGVALVRRTGAQVAAVADAQQRLRALAERIQKLTDELDENTSHFPL